MIFYNHMYNCWSSYKDVLHKGEKFEIDRMQNEKANSVDKVIRKRKYNMRA